MTQTERRTLLVRLNAAFDDNNASLRILDQDGPVGYIWIEFRAHAIAYLLDIFVTPSYRRQGRGTILMAETIRLARRRACAELRLAVAVRNTIAQAVFQAQGASPRQSQMREGQAWLEMAISLG